MERLEQYDFKKTRPPTQLELNRRAFIDKLCDGHIWRFHMREFPRTSDNFPAKASTIATMILNRIKKLHPKWDIEMKVEDNGFIVIRCNRIGG